MYFQKLILIGLSLLLNNNSSDNIIKSSSITEISTEDKTQAYCTPGPTTPWNNYIRSVVFESISNPIPQQDEKSASTTPTGVHDYTSYTTDVYIGNTYTINIISKLKWFDPNNNGTGYVYVWIDLNGDDDFDDAGENVLAHTEVLIEGGNDEYTTSEPITIPSSASAVSTRMRIIARQGGVPTPCDTNNFTGEVEDYSINILAGTDTIPPTVSLTASNNPASGQFTVTSIFSEVVTGVDLADFQLNNGTASNFNGSGTTYSIDVDPIAEGQVSIVYPAGNAQDNAGNNNLLSDTLFVQFLPGSCGYTSNLSLNKITSQSSTHNGGVSERAVDGNTDGSFYNPVNPSVAETNYESESWWEVDLGNIYDIESVNLWNRDDNVYTYDYYLLISDIPFVTTDLSLTLNDPNVWSFHDPDTMGYPTNQIVNRTGRYIRIQKNGTGFTTLAEVQVMGCAVDFYKLKTNLDASYTLPSNGKLSFTYKENYHTSPNQKITCNIYDWRRNLISAPINLNNSYGANWQTLNVSALGLTVGEFYTIEIDSINKNEKHYLTFRYCNESGDLFRCIEDNQSNELLIPIKIALEGAWLGDIDAMKDELRQGGYIPLAEPFTAMGFTHIGDGGNESIAPSVLNASGANAIVDWIFVELRTQKDTTSKIATRAALLQSDGDIVDLDGVSTLKFLNIPYGQYYVIVRDRNHLGVRTKDRISLSNTTNTIDFLTDTTIYQNILAFKDLGDGYYGLISGDVDGNGQVQTTDQSLLTPDIGLSGYRASDLNYDGQVQNTDLQNFLTPNLGKGIQFEY